MAVENSNMDFGSLFGELLKNGKSAPFGDIYTSSKEEVVETDDDFNPNLKKELDDLKEEFKQYRNRVANTLETEKKHLKSDILRGFLSEFVVFLVNTYKGKKEHGKVIEDEDIMILKKMNDYLDSMGVAPMEDATGKEFDYKTMEAIYSDHNSNQKEGTVTKVIYNGFTLDGEVLLPQKVAVVG